jgi:hypothetical protein
MASRKLPKRLFKNKDVVHSYQHERENKLDMKSMSRDHLDVLQNIEFTLVKGAGQDDRIDDRTVDEALGLALRGREPGEDADPFAVAIYEMLDDMRVFREDVPDNIWQAGLKTVRDSVRRHSTLAPGEKRYLRFVEKYVR